jgi:hypothetical protein
VPAKLRPSSCAARGEGEAGERGSAAQALRSPDAGPTPLTLGPGSIIISRSSDVFPLHVHRRGRGSSARASLYLASGAQPPALADLGQHPARDHRSPSRASSTSTARALSHARLMGWAAELRLCVRGPYFEFVSHPRRRVCSAHVYPSSRRTLSRPRSPPPGYFADPGRRLRLVAASVPAKAALRAAKAAHEAPARAQGASAGL